MKTTPLKKSFAAFLIIGSLTLAGCFNFGSGSTTQTPKTDATTKVYETGDFTITVPVAWEVIEKKDFTSDVPTQTVVVFRNNVKNETFTANIVIINNALQQPVETLEYAKMVNNRQKSGLYDYKETTHEDFKISIGGNDVNTYFVGFEAKKTAAENAVRYLQTYAVKGNNAYIVTGALSPAENDSVAKTIEDAVKSFKLK